ncbi:zwei Ig domain protein zig-8 [Sergentomyia squamirostris]
MSHNNYSERQNVAYFIIISCLYHFQHLRTIWSLPGSSGAILLDRPYFDDVSSRNVTAVVDETAILKCRVRNRANRTISWMRKRDLHILTSNTFTYTSDQRFSVDHPANSDDWNLKIEYAQRRDSGIYECQVNTEPKINMAFHLEVTDLIAAARARILGSHEVHVKKGSTISLACSVNVHASSVSWLHDSAVVDFDSARGGISLETEKTDTGTTSRLMLTRAAFRDSGNYTCQPAGAVSASVIVHVLNGEHPAAMQTSSAMPCPSPTTLIVVGILLLGSSYHSSASWRPCADHL